MRRSCGNITFGVDVGVYYRKRGSASYIVREVRSVRERERQERERERERREREREREGKRERERERERD